MSKVSKGIKIKTTVKDVKALDKSTVAAERMKQAYIRTKDKAEHGVYAEESSPGEYASDRFSSGVDSVSHEAVHQFDKQGRKGVQTTKENISKVKENIQKRKAAAEQPKNKRRNGRHSKPGSLPVGVDDRQRTRFLNRLKPSDRSTVPLRRWIVDRKASRRWTGAERPSSRPHPLPEAR